MESLTTIIILYFIAAFYLVIGAFQLSETDTPPPIIGTETISDLAISFALSFIAFLLWPLWIKYWRQIYDE